MKVEKNSARDGRLRIAHFHTTLPQEHRKPGGVEVWVHRLANALVDLEQDEVTVFSSVKPPADARYRYRSVFPEARWLSRPLGRTLILPAALNFFDFRAFDLLHLHGDDWFLLRRPIVTVRTLYGSALREAQHAPRLRNRLFMYGIYGLEHVSVRLCSRALALGSDTANLYGISERISPGVSATVFYPGEKHPTPRVLFIGAWNGRKRGRFVFDVFVRDVLPHFPDAELCMVSDYCPQHPRVIAEIAPDDATLARRLREAWVFALPSTYEGFGIPYLESLASGTPVVATPNPGSRDVLQDGKYGILASDESFGQSIRDLLGSREDRERLATLGLERSRAHSWRASAIRHREMYIQAIRGSAASML